MEKSDDRQKQVQEVDKSPREKRRETNNEL